MAITDLVSSVRACWPCSSPPSVASARLPAEAVLTKPDTYTYPRMSPDGQKLSIVATEGSSQDVCVYDVKRSNGASQPQRIIESRDVLYPMSFTPDGKRLSYIDVSQKTGYDMWTAASEDSPQGLKAGKPEPFRVTSNDERHGAFSPDGLCIG